MQGVAIAGLSITDAIHPVPLGIVTGLVLGKQIGVLATCWLAVRLGIASPPDGVGWRLLYGTALLCGIGFTMSLFIASLAFEHSGTAYMGLERLGILLGSLVSGLLGYLVLRRALGNRAGATSHRVGRCFTPTSTQYAGRCRAAAGFKPADSPCQKAEARRKHAQESAISKASPACRSAWSARGRLDCRSGECVAAVLSGAGLQKNSPPDDRRPIERPYRAHATNANI